MCDYQICSLDSGGLTVIHHAIDCADDLAAMAHAHGILRAGGVAEIWAGLRNVAVVTVPFTAAAAQA